MNLTNLETIVFEAISKNSNPHYMECIDILDLEILTRITSKVLRGVISSLVKKDLIEVEKWHNGNRKAEYYWNRKEAIVAFSI